MTNEDLVAIIESEVATSIGGGSAGVGSSSVSGGTNAATKQLSTERAMELDYYNSQPFGNEREGESQVVSSDVFDAVESMLPHLLKTFTASDDAVMFEPVGPEDEEAAAQRTDVCNYVFYKQNNGFLLMYEWFKDALLQKNGIVKYWWEEKEEVTEDDWEGLTEGEYLTLKQDDDVEILSEKAYDDETAVQQRQQMAEKLQQAMQNPQSAQQAQMALQQLAMQPIPQMYDCKTKTTKDKSKLCIKAIPPESFGISAKHMCVSIQDAPFCYHEEEMTISDLRSMGCPESVIEESGNNDTSFDAKPEVLARNRFIDEGARGADELPDESLRKVKVKDGFIRVDFDGDGKAELRHFILVNRVTWVNEPASHINFAAITPIIMPHRWIGKSIAEIVMDFQFMNSVLLRQMFNNLYLSNNPQKVVLGTAGGQVMADVDKLMTSRVGGILVEYAPNAIRNQEVPFVAGASFPMLEYMEGKKEQRTGNTRYNQGTDADSLNKTARGISMIQSAAQQKMDLIARIFAETGIKDLFRGIAYFLSKYSTKEMTLKLRGKWVDIDPRQWKNQFDMTVNVGLGTGNKDAQLVHLAKMHEMQVSLMQEGRGYMVTDQNVYNLNKKMSENMGFKHPELFVTSPENVQKPPPQPNPEILKLQQADQEVKAKIQSNEKIRQFDAQTQKEIEGMKLKAQFAIAQMQEATKKEIERMKIDAESQMGIFNAHNALKDEAAALGEEKLKLQVDKELHNIQKQVATESLQAKDQAITQESQRAKESETTAKNDVSKSIEPIAKAVKEQTQAIKGIEANQKELATAVTQIKDEKDKSSKEKKKPRVYDVKKSESGYQITSQG